MKKCPYCDFNSHPLKGDVDQDAYRVALEQDWAAQQQPNDYFASVFFGGGTPSLFHPRHLDALLANLPIAANAETTLEVNPGTQEYMDFKDYVAAGVNRLSIGAQSFSESQLKKLGRIHHSADISNAFIKARAAGVENINLDLMWGLPGQTVATAMSDLERAIDLQPEHISWYQLTIEAKTEFAKRTPILPVEQAIYDIEQSGLELLAQAGFERYEISGFARSGRRCQHNVNYWQFGDYVGLGAGAHGKRSFLNGDTLTPTRTKKVSQPRLYMADPQATEQQAVAAEDVVLEFLMNALRLIDGVDWALFERHTGCSRSSVTTVWNDLVSDGLVRPQKCAASAKGLRYLDSLLQRFI